MTFLLKWPCSIVLPRSTFHSWNGVLRGSGIWWKNYGFCHIKDLEVLVSFPKGSSTYSSSLNWLASTHLSELNLNITSLKGPHLKHCPCAWPWGSTSQDPGTYWLHECIGLISRMSLRGCLLVPLYVILAFALGEVNGPIHLGWSCDPHGVPCGVELCLYSSLCPILSCREVPRNEDQ